MLSLKRNGAPFLWNGCAVLAEYAGKLDERMFAAVHGSFIVNLKHVHSVSSGMVMLTDGTELGVTRGYRKELTKKHIAFVQGGM